MLKHLALMDTKSIGTVLAEADPLIYLHAFTKAIANKVTLPADPEEDPSLYYEGEVIPHVETYFDIFHDLRAFDKNEAHTFVFLFWISRYGVLHPGGYEEIEEPFNSQHFFGYGIGLPEEMVEYCTVNAPELMRHVVIATNVLEQFD